MRTLLTILFLTTYSCIGQTYQQFQKFSYRQLANLKDNIPKEYYSYLLQLISKRDTTYLKQRLNTTNSKKVYLIEGYNFKTDNYSLFEEYIDPNKTNEKYHWSYSNFRLDEKPVTYMQSSYFLSDTAGLRKSKSSLDTIFPRKYRYGVGCVVSDESDKISNDLGEKARRDGVIIEEYCKIVTFIDLSSRQLSIKFLFPIAGRREFEHRGSGMLTDYTPGLDFWLFASPYIVDKQNYTQQ